MFMCIEKTWYKIDVIKGRINISSSWKIMDCEEHYNPFTNSGTKKFEDLQKDQIVELYRHIRLECSKCSILPLCKIW